MKNNERLYILYPTFFEAIKIVVNFSTYSSNTQTIDVNWVKKRTKKFFLPLLLKHKSKFVTVEQNKLVKNNQTYLTLDKFCLQCSLNF